MNLREAALVKALDANLDAMIEASAPRGSLSCYPRKTVAQVSRTAKWLKKALVDLTVAEKIPSPIK